MTQQVDFYLISNQISDAKFKLASRLCNKIQRMNKKTLVLTDCPADTDVLDKILWSFSDTSFVAHDDVGDAKHCNLQIGDAALLESATEISDYDVLINLAKEIPDQTKSYLGSVDRIAEIVEQGETAKAAARVRFSAYKKLGYELKTHPIEL